MKKLFSNLTFWVLIAICAAVLLGRFAPQVALKPVLDHPIKTKLIGQEINIGSTLSEFLSGIFISIVKLFINPIIFLTITLGTVSMGDLRKVGRVGLKALLYFEIVTTFALIIGVMVAIVIRPGHGISTLLPLGKLMITVYITMAIFIFGALGLILRYYRVSIFKYLKYIREELLVVLGTSSSEAALPSVMEKLERMGCSKPVVGLVVPAGYSFNLDGTTIYLSMFMFFFAQVFNAHISLVQIFSIIGILMVTSKGAAGVTGSGFLVLASTLTAIKVIPVEGLALLLGVDRFMSEARAITNFIGNGVATIWIANNEKEFDRKKMNYAFGHVAEMETINKNQS